MTHPTHSRLVLELAEIWTRGHEGDTEYVLDRVCNSYPQRDFALTSAAGPSHVASRAAALALRLEADIGGAGYSFASALAERAERLIKGGRR